MECIEWLQLQIIEVNKMRYKNHVEPAHVYASICIQILVQKRARNHNR
jgi:hypothetical protein